MKKNLILEKVDEACSNQEFIEIHSYCGSEGGFAVGQIIAHSQDDLLIHAIDNRGMDDGYFVGRIKDVCKISTNTSYLRDVQNLSAEEKAFPVYPNGFCDNLNLFEYYITLFKSNKTLVTIYTYQKETIHGIVVDCVSETIKLIMINENGITDGETIIYTNDIETLSFESIEEMRLQRLCNLKVGR